MEPRAGTVGRVASSTPWSVDAVPPTTIVNVIAVRNGRSGGCYGAVVEG